MHWLQKNSTSHKDLHPLPAASGCIPLAWWRLGPWTRTRHPQSGPWSHQPGESHGLQIDQPEMCKEKGDLETQKLRSSTKQEITWHPNLVRLFNLGTPWLGYISIPVSMTDGNNGWISIHIAFIDNILKGRKFRPKVIRCGLLKVPRFSDFIRSCNLSLLMHLVSQIEKYGRNHTVVASMWSGCFQTYIPICALYVYVHVTCACTQHNI